MKEKSIKSIVLTLEEFERMQTLHTSKFDNLKAKVVEALRLLSVVHRRERIIDVITLGDYFGVSYKEVITILHQVFSPAELIESWNAACEGKSKELYAHPYIQKRVLYEEASFQDIEEYFIEFDSLKELIKEFRPIALTGAKMERILNRNIKPLLKMSQKEFETIMEIHRPKMQLSEMELLLHCFSKILEFGDRKTITLKQLEKFLGCDPSYLDKSLIKLFRTLENDIRNKTYKDLVYEYRRTKKVS